MDLSGPAVNPFAEREKLQATTGGLPAPVGGGGAYRRRHCFWFRLASGRGREQYRARRAFENAYRLSQNYAAFNEDARVQLQKLKTQQAMMGINMP